MFYNREKKKLKRKTKEENRAPDYVILKEGSKAGMDLLKDKFGYTYTMRKVINIYSFGLKLRTY